MGRPALVIAHEEGHAHGSGRSVAGFHLLEAVTFANTDGDVLFDRFGGHAHAVGFSMPSGNVPALRTRLSTYAAGRITSEMMQQRLDIDAELTLEELDQELMKKLRLLEPYGQANREPLFLARNLTIAEDPRTLKERHLKLKLRSASGVHTACLCWSRAVQWPERLAELDIKTGSQIDAVFKVRENKHPDFGGIEMELCDMRSTPATDIG